MKLKEFFQSLFKSDRDIMFETYRQNPFTIRVDEEQRIVVVGGKVVNKYIKEKELTYRLAMIGYAVIRRPIFIPRLYKVVIQKYDLTDHENITQTHTVTEEEYNSIDIGDRVEFERKF